MSSARQRTAIESLLKQNRDTAVRVLVVWEPMLATDWSHPSGMVQSRISDLRVAQFWDKDHLVAKAMDQQITTQPSCCRRDGILWDLAAMYPPKVEWEKSAPIFIDGPVVAISGAVQQRLSTSAKSNLLTPE
jgi:hypothetical protein